MSASTSKCPRRSRGADQVRWVAVGRDQGHLRQLVRHLAPLEGRVVHEDEGLRGQSERAGRGAKVLRLGRPVRRDDRERVRAQHHGGVLAQRLLDRRGVVAARQHQDHALLA